MSAYDTLQKSLDNEDMFTPYSPESIRLYIIYLEELFPGMGQRVAGHLGVIPYDKALAPVTPLKTPTIAPVTDLDPQSATLPEGRYHGTLNKNRFYIHVPALRADFRVIPSEICGASVETISVGQLLEVSINASFETALRVVIVGNQDSVKAYEALVNAPKKETPAVNPRSKIIRETLYQKAQRLEREALQREQARQNPHTPQDTRYVFYNNDGTYDIDDKDGHEMTF